MLHPIITKEALYFLQNLKNNNDRDWFTEHKKEFQRHQKDIKGFFVLLKERLNAHDDIDRLKMFRIYRDIRFSKDKTPYKTHFSGSFARTGVKLRGGYYLHIEPDNSFIATGFWQPNKDDLLRIRKEFEQDASELRKIMNEKELVEVWGKLKGDEVKTAPKGFDREHQNIDLIKKKQFIFTKNFTDQEVLAPKFIDELDRSFQAIRPYFDYMSEVLTTDINGAPLFSD